MMAINRKSAAEIASTRLIRSNAVGSELCCSPAGSCAVLICSASDMSPSNHAISYNKTYEVVVNVTNGVRKKTNIRHLACVMQGNMTTQFPKVLAT